MNNENRTDDSSEQEIKTVTENSKSDDGERKKAPVFPKLPEITYEQKQKLPDDSLFMQTSGRVDDRLLMETSGRTDLMGPRADLADARGLSGGSPEQRPAADQGKASPDNTEPDNAGRISETQASETETQTNNAAAGGKTEIIARGAPGEGESGTDEAAEGPESTSREEPEAEAENASAEEPEAQAENASVEEPAEDAGDASAPDVSDGSGIRSQKGMRERSGEQQKRTGNANAAKQRDYQERIRRHRRRIRALRITVALLVAVLAVVFGWYLTHRSYSRAELSRVTDFASEEGTSYLSVNGYVVQYGPNGASCTDGRGHVSWSITYEMDSPIISSAGNMIALADYGGHTVYLMDTQTQVNTITTSLPVHMLTVSENGEVAAVLDDADSTWIRLYGSDGQEIAYFVRDMQENGYPVALAISPDGTQVCVSSLLMKNVSVKSYLSFYDFSSSGRNYDQNMVGDFDYTDEIFPYVTFLDNDSCAAVSDSRLVIYDTSSTQTQSGTNIMFDESLQGVFSGDRCIGLLFNDKTGENLYTLSVYGEKGRMKGEVGFSMQYTDVQIAGGRVYINNDQSLQIYSAGGRKIFDGGLDRSIRAVVPASRLRGLFVVAENEIDSVTLR